MKKLGLSFYETPIINDPAAPGRVLNRRAFMLPPTDRIPIFPLHAPLFYPGRTLPLHIFETRYRALMKDALAADGRFAMGVFRPGWEKDYEGRPPIFDTICIGKITKYNKLPDGRYLLKLVGEARAKVVLEEDGKPYRIGIVNIVKETPLTKSEEACWKTAITDILTSLCGKLLSPPRDPDCEIAPPSAAIDFADEAILHLPLTLESRMLLYSIPEHSRRLQAVADCAREIIQFRNSKDKDKPSDPANN
ncbi:MAG: LON peptidase substrate-binding domain-containing protein [Planctomycetota bacterium]